MTGWDWPDKGTYNRESRTFPVLGKDHSRLTELRRAAHRQHRSRSSSCESKLSTFRCCQRVGAQRLSGVALDGVQTLGRPEITFGGLTRIGTVLTPLFFFV
jgi:hypothetical protein